MIGDLDPGDMWKEVQKQNHAPQLISAFTSELSTACGILFGGIDGGGSS